MALWSTIGTIGTAIYNAWRGREDAKDQQPQTGYDVVTMPQYSFTEPRMKLTSDFYTQNIERLMRGEYPTYYDTKGIGEGLKQEAYKTAFGRPGERTGTAQMAMETGALTGMGGAATGAQVSKVYKDYAERSSAIDTFLAKLGVDVSREAAGRIPYMSQMMPRGPDAQIVTYGRGQAPQPSAPLDIPWDKIFPGSTPTTPNTDMAQGYATLDQYFSTSAGGNYGGYTPPPGYFPTQNITYDQGFDRTLDQWSEVNRSNYGTYDPGNQYLSRF